MNAEASSGWFFDLSVHFAQLIEASFNTVVDVQFQALFGAPQRWLG